jgi:hypothetical protein
LHPNGPVSTKPGQLHGSGLKGGHESHKRD